MSHSQFFSLGATAVGRLVSREKKKLFRLNWKLK
jgi:hypothetical protein